MEMATDEPTPTASHQELSGSNTGHFTVTYDSEDANYCARVDELVRAIESMPFVNQLGPPRFTLSVADDNKFRALCE